MIRSSIELNITCWCNMEKRSLGTEGPIRIPIRLTLTSDLKRSFKAIKNTNDFNISLRSCQSQSSNKFCTNQEIRHSRKGHQ
ncbi:hypothetical protein Anas_14718, partial [Armadillidium nasatum]